MHIVIIGAGVVGSSLAEYLNREKHTLSIVDRDRAVCNEVQEKMDLMVLCGASTSPTILEEAGLRDADMVIAVTPDDANNILVCGIARQFGVPRRIARIRSMEFTRRDSVSLADLGVTDVIDPEKVVVDAILDRLQSPGALEALGFNDRSVLLRSYRVTEQMPINGKTLIEIRGLAEPHVILTVAVIRDDKTIIPHGEFVVRAGDRLINLLPAESLPGLHTLVGRSSDLASSRVIISGDSLTSRNLAIALESLAAKVILVVPDMEHGKKAADQLVKAEVLYGDCTDTDLMQELRLCRTDWFIGADIETEYNMMSCLLARSLGVGEVICVSHEPRHDQLLYSIGIDHVINPRVTIAREILETVMSGQIHTSFSLRQANVEVLRLLAAEDSPITRDALSRIWPQFHSEAIVGALLKDERMVLPRGDTKLEAGDEVIVLVRLGAEEKIRALFNPPGSIVDRVKQLLPVR